MTIRHMTTADLAAVVEIDQMSFSLPWPAGAFQVELSNPMARCWVAEIPGDSLPAGGHRVVAALVNWLVLDECHVATIAVHPDFRRQGIARLLMQTGMQAAYAEGARIFHLEVRAGNLAAQQMYLDFGYAVVGRRIKYYKDNGEDALLMTLDLTQAGTSR